ncbi:unnamed protein product [Oikopleura dioica]|uniref:Claudin n=1 Tax=Oikopleura dioica TaxID=34765 RepID=E4XNV9_OIKDI|nr:unnamed protein product [Oikopleura dioica]
MLEGFLSEKVRIGATISTSLAGIGCFLGGMGTHPLISLEPKPGSFFPTRKEISLWKVTEYSLDEPGNSTTKTWAMFTGSPSPMPVEIGVSMTILASVTALSCFFRLRRETRLVSAHGNILAGFLALTALLSVKIGFSVEHVTSNFFSVGLASFGIGLLFLCGIFGHYSADMMPSTPRFAIQNLIFYFVCSLGCVLSLTGCFMTTIGDSTPYCTVPLGLCTRFEPPTKIGFFEKCLVEERNGSSETNCNSWDDQMQSMLAGIFVCVIFKILTLGGACVVKFLNIKWRQFSASLVVLSIGFGVMGLSLAAVFLAAFYHENKEGDLRYIAPYYGAAYWLFCSGVISSLIAGATILGEEVDEDEDEEFDHLKKPSLVLTGTDNDAFSTESASISGEESTNM